MTRSALALFVTLTFAWGLAAQTPTPQPATASQTTTTLHLNTQEVNLDMVFHDKRGRAIHDIRPEEVHVYEDGAEEHLKSFRFLQETTATAPATPASTGSIPVDPMRELRLVTLVFENLDLDGKRFFRQALDDILKMAPEQNLYFSVVVIDQKLNMIQPFTNDRAALLKAVDKSAAWTTLQYWKNSSEIKGELQSTLSQGAPTLTSTSGPGGSGPSASAIQASVNFTMAKMQFDMLEQADAADREASARGTIDALLALVGAQSKLPGRKVVLYFNPNLFIPEVNKEQYSFMVSAANRGNITFYTVDPKGLVTFSQNGSAGGALGDASVGHRDLSQTGVGQVGAAAGETRNLSTSGGTGEVKQSQAQAQETAENGLRSNPLMWLRDLAAQTGGSTIAETNNVKAPLKEVMDDVQTYYEATYDPHVQVLDGKFHRISVKLDRPGIEVYTRSGYFALPQAVGRQQVFAYEVPLMNALNAATASADVSFRIAAERFSERGPKIEYMLTLEAPLKGLTFAPQPSGKTALLDATMLIEVKNSSGEIVEKFSKPFAVEVALDTVEARKQGDLIQTFRTELDPGNYSVDAVVMDRKGNKIGVTKTPLTVPAPSESLAISDVVVVRRNDQLKDNQILDPFYYQGGKVTPTLDNTLKGGKGSYLPFYFAVYPDPTIKDAPKVTMAFYKEGQYLGSAPVQLGPVQKDGRIPYIAALPGDPFTPGSYEIKLDAAQGSSTAEEKVDFKVD
jgi:VWFA-related protein